MSTNNMDGFVQIGKRECFSDRGEMGSGEFEEIKFKERGSEVFITLESDNKKVFGRAGCNRFFGTYEQNESQLTFSGMGATRMACPDMDIETSFFKVLEDTKSFIIKNDKLTLKDNNNVIAVFKAQKETPEKE